VIKPAEPRKPIIITKNVEKIALYFLVVISLSSCDKKRVLMNINLVVRGTKTVL
jgi:hypothetical protein